MKRILPLLAILLLLLPTKVAAQWNGTGYRSFYDAGTSIAIAGQNKTSFEISTSQGYQVIPTYLYLGTGAAFQVFFNTNGSYAFPIFANIRSNLSAGKRSPFIDIRIGYAPLSSTDYYDDGGLYFNPSIGMRFALGNNIGLNIRAGYTLQYAQIYDVWTDNDGYYNDGWYKMNIGGITLQLGIEF